MASETLKRALALIECERVFEALPLLDQVIAAEPDNGTAYIHRARVRRRLGNHEGAITDYTQAIKVAPTVALYLARALTWLSLDNAKGAIADSRQAIALTSESAPESSPESAGAHRLLGKALGKLGDGPGAIAAYKQAARHYIAATDKANAQACLDAIEPLKQLPAYDYTQEPDPTERLNTPISALAGPEKPASPDDYVRLVEEKYEAGEYTAAMKDLTWLLDIEPHHAAALCLRGLIQAQLGRREQAVADLALAKQHHPDDPHVQFSRGHMRLIFKDGDGAVEEFTALINAAGQPNEAGKETGNERGNEAGKRKLASYFQGRGDSYRVIGLNEQAFKDYSNAIALAPHSADLYERRADMQKLMGATEGAIADYQQAATLWLDAGNWQKHQFVVDTVRQIRAQSATPTSGTSPHSATVPIKTFENHQPVVEVVLDGIATFDIVIDRNAAHSIITRSMASRLNLEAVSFRYVYLADGTPIELPIGRLRSIGVGATIVTDVYVAIAPDKATPVLGKDCFSAYSIRISGNEMSFVRR